MTLDPYNVIAPKPPYPAVAFLISKAPGPSARRERRATPRVQVELCCEDRSGPRRFYGTTFDLSTFGVSTQCGRSHAPGTELAIRLHLPDDLCHPLDLCAVVVGEHEACGGMRLAFRSPPAQAVRRIHKYLFGRMDRLLAAA